MNKIIWKLLFVFMFIVILIVSHEIDILQISAKTGFALVTYSIGLFLGVIMGIIATELKYAYRK